MRIRKKDGQISNQYGQLEPPDAQNSPSVAPATDIPGISEAYVRLVAKALASLEAKDSYQNKDINAIASIGRSVAMLQVIEDSRSGSDGNGKQLKDMTTEQLRQLVAKRTAQDSIPDAEFEENE